ENPSSHTSVSRLVKSTPISTSDATHFFRATKSDSCRSRERERPEEHPVACAPGSGARSADILKVLPEGFSMADLTAKRDRLLTILREMPRAVVAFSGGIDSTVVAQAAFFALGENATAVTSDSPSVPRAELAGARELAARIGIAHHIVQTEEFDNA